MNIKTFFLNLLISPFFLTATVAKKSKVGGQAIIEGVMMRSKQKISWAVKKANGEIVIERFPFISLCKKHKNLSFPIVRGFINLFESLKIGYHALSRSAEIASMDLSGQAVMKTHSSPKAEKLSLIFSFAFALVFSFGLFMYLPMFISQQFFNNSSIAFNFAAGTIRISLFIVYIVVISFWKDIHRVFQYHGAEHKAIFAFEDNKDLTIENMKHYTTLHPRCGTSFLLLVALICILLFSVIDTIFSVLIGPYPSVFIRFLVHISLIPLVAGTSYEVLRLSDRYQHITIVKMFILPGLWLQKITTKEPTDEQLKVAAAALKASL